MSKTRAWIKATKSTQIIISNLPIPMLDNPFFPEVPLLAADELLCESF